MNKASIRWMAGGVSRKIARYTVFRPFIINLEAPVVSFSFDDFPHSAAENAAPLLEDAGMRGTWYLASGLMGRDENGQRITGPETVTALANKGHEIGGHTHGHIDVQQTPRTELIADIERNDREIQRLTGARPLDISFAYPFGMISVPSKLTLMNRYAGLRGIKTGINHGIVDLAHLLSQELYDASSDEAHMNKVLDEAERLRGWLIFYTHDVRQDPSSIGCSPSYFGKIVEIVRKRGIKVETVAQTLARVGASPRRAAT